MKTAEEYQKAINELTLLIKDKYPELYQHLGENPITIASKGGGEIREDHFKEYYEALEEMVNNHISTHQAQ